jgi:hypothetical protein
VQIISFTQKSKTVQVEKWGQYLEREFERKPHWGNFVVIELIPKGVHFEATFEVNFFLNT